MFAPIALFVYNRPEHTRQTVQALLKNPEAANSILYIYADGAKQGATEEDTQKIKETREVAKQISGFSEIRIVEAEKNLGLANSVIKGTTEVANAHGKVITLEDDVIVANSFLSYMNTALELYSKENKVMMVAGYNFPFDNATPASSAYFLPLTSTQAWGTWKRAWDKFDPQATGYLALKSDKVLERGFNFNNSYPYSKMLVDQMELKKVDSWAIRWWWTVFKQNGLVLYPDRSLIYNIGWDSSGTHCEGDDPYKAGHLRQDYAITNYPSVIQKDEEKTDLLQSYLRGLTGRKNEQRKSFLHTLGIQLKKMFP